SLSRVSRPVPDYKYPPRSWVRRAGQKGRASLESAPETFADPRHNHTHTNGATHFLPVCPDNTGRSDKWRHTTMYPSPVDKTEYAGLEKRLSSHSLARLLRIARRRTAAEKRSTRLKSRE